MTKKTVKAKKTRTNPVAFHFRSAEVPERGGITVAYNPVTNKFGVAVCQQQDNFCRNEGFTRAVGRSQSANKSLPSKVKKPTMAQIREQAKKIALSAQHNFNEHIQKQIDSIVKMLESQFVRVVTEKPKSKKRKK